MLCFCTLLGGSHCLFAGNSWLALQGALESAALAFKAIHKRPPVLVIDGVDSIAKCNRKLAFDIVSLAKARASCHRPFALLTNSAGCEAPSACCTVPCVPQAHSDNCVGSQTWADLRTMHVVFVASDGTFLNVIYGTPPPASASLLPALLLPHVGLGVKTLNPKCRHSPCGRLLGRAVGSGLQIEPNRR